MNSQPNIAIEIGRSRLHALAGRLVRGDLRVTHAISIDRPADIPSDDGLALGSWIGSVLKEAGFPKGPAVVALAREHVSLKRLTLPTNDSDELPDMARLAMRRDMQMDAESTIIDYAVVDRGESSTTVLAVAIPEGVYELTRQAVRAAGHRISRVSLRTMGTVTLIREMAGREAMLAVDVAGESVEFVVLENGSVRFSRSAEIAGDAPTEALAEQVLTEARRTWMSYRIIEDASDVRRAAVMGALPIAESVAKPLADMLRVPARAMTKHASVSDAQADMAGAWPLAGLLLADPASDSVIDFQHPKKAPDLASRRRQRVMMLAGAAIVLVAAAVMLGQVQIKRMNNEARSIEARAAGLRDAYLRYNREAYRLEHLKRWDDASPDWIGHALQIAKSSPPPDQIVLDSWTGSLQFDGVEYDRRTHQWSVPKRLTIVLDGEARDRATADAFRSHLVDSALYDTTSTGSEARSGSRLPFGFTYRLRTTEVQPADGEDAS